MSQYFFILDSRDFILDPRTRKVVAIIRNGEVFRHDDGAKIAVFVGSSLYDLNGNFLGTLDGCTRSLPIALGKLLEGSSAADSPYPLSLPRRAPAASLSQPKYHVAVALTRAPKGAQLVEDMRLEPDLPVAFLVARGRAGQLGLITEN